MNLAGNVHFDAPAICDGQREVKFAVAAAVMLSLVIFTIDLAIPLGVAAGVPYIAVVLTAWWIPSWRGAFVLASVSTAFIVIGYLYSQEAGVPWMVAANRALAVFAIWTTAVLLLLAKRSAQSLEELVRERTRALRELGVFDAEKPLGLSDYMLPEFRPMFDRLFEQSAQALRDDPTRELPAAEYDFAIETPSGKIKWIYNSSQAYVTDEGEIAWNGVSFDITERKEMEVALREPKSSKQRTKP